MPEIDKEKKQKIRNLYRRELELKPRPIHTLVRPPAPARPEEPSTAEAEPERTDLGKHTPVSNQTGRIGALESEEPDFGEMGSSDDQSDLEVSADTTDGAGPELEMAEAADEELMLDAWYAEYGDPSTRVLLRNKEATTMIHEVVIDEDDRVQVTGINQNYPWRCICSLKITANDGSRWIGTGWLIGPRVLVTAGHCIFIHSRGGWARSIEVIPGRDGSERPFESCHATNLRSVRGWTEDQDAEYDYGAIILPEDCRYGDQLGWFGFSNYSDSTLSDLVVNLAGYPGDKPAGTQWFHSRTVKEVGSRSIVYDIDTAGGMSGAPVWAYRGGNRYGAAIHTNGAVTGNSGTRITQDVFDNMVSWKNQAE